MKKYSAPPSHRTSIAMLIIMVCVRLGAMFAMLKFIAFKFGPEGFGAISQIMGVAAIFYTFAGGGLTNGLIKHVAEDSSGTSRAAWLSASGLIAIASSAGLAIVAIALYFFGAEPIFSDRGLAPVFLVIGVTQILVGIGNISIAYLSGVSDLRRFVYANGVGNLLAVAILIGLTYTSGIDGAYFGAAALPLAPSLLGIWYVFKFHWPDAFSINADGPKIKRLLQFFASMLLASIAVPLAQIYMRADLGNSIGWQPVGYWQVVARTSDAYMQVFGVLFINFLLPQLSRARGHERLRMLFKVGAAVIGLFIIGSAAYYVLRGSIIRIAFSPEFLPAKVLVGEQILGDFAKVAGLLIVYYFVSVGRIWIQGITEVAQAALTIALFLALRPRFGIEAAVLSYSATCIFIMVVLAGLFVAHVGSRNEDVDDLHTFPTRDGK
jgi:O-antigen/teichoic acid export membrane protein